MEQIVRSPAERAFYTHVLAHLKNFSNVIDVTRFVNSQHWSMQQIMRLYMEVLWDSPEIFYVSKCVQVSWGEYPDGRIQYAKLIGINYAFPREEYELHRQKLEIEVRKAVRYAAGETSPEMIALRLHDYIVQVCDYDSVAFDNEDPSPLARTTYSVLVRKKAVCEGYSMAYRYLLKKFNIRCEEIVSNEMNHCWNYVNIRGNWYHVDVTYDDPIFTDGVGRVLEQGLNFLLSGDSHSISRDHFLMSDQKARRQEHYGWDTKGLPPAANTAFDHRIWPSR
jgi:hypothetical protein